MSSENDHRVGGISFSDRFCREIRRLWNQLADEEKDTIVDVQRARRSWKEELSDHDWTVYFVSKSIAPAQDVLTVDGLPIYIRTADRERLKGKVVDFDAGSLLVISR